MSLQIKGKFIRLEHGESLKIMSSGPTPVELDLIKINEVSGKVEVLGEEVAIKSAVDSAIASEVSSRQSEDAVLDGKITTEKNRAEAAELALSGRVSALEVDPVTKTHVDTEVARLDGRIDSVLSNIDPAALDSLSEVVAAFQSADGSLTTAINNLSTSSSSAIAAEETRALAAEAGLAADIAAETAARNTALTQVVSDFQAAVAGETATRIAQDTATLTSAQNYADTAVSAEQSRAEQAESGLQSAIDAVATDLAQELLDRAADVNAEESRAMGVEASLAGRLDVIEGSGEGSVAKAESDAKDYADAAVLVEKNRAVGAEATLFSAISAEQSRAEGVESALDGRLDVLEARAHHKMKFELTSTDISNGYVTLGHEAMASSIVASVGRLMIHEGAADDFTVSTVGGVTRMTFVNSLVTPGQEKLSAGDVVFVKYMA